jgi:general secretion pathway protein G
MGHASPATPFALILVVALSSCEVKVSHHYQSDAARIKADIYTIKEALDSYAMQHGGDYPNSLGALVVPDEQGHRFLNRATVPKDPWNEEYGYEPPVPGYPQPRVFTLGKDKSIGGTGDDEDIDYAAIVNGQ